MKSFLLLFVFSFGSHCVLETELEESTNNSDLADSCRFSIPPDVAAFSQCGHIDVPLNWATETSNSITLDYLVVKGKQSGNATFLLDGGPGQNGNSILSKLNSRIIRESLLELGDVVVLAQRGTEYTSAHLTCATDKERCLEELRQKYSIQDFSGFTTEASAKDIGKLVDRLGYNFVNLYGVSYGTRLGFEVMRILESKVRASVMDSVLPNGINQNDISGLFDTLRTLDQKCADDSVCQESMSGERVLNYFFDALENLNQQPYNYRDRLGKLQVTAEEFIRLIFLQAYSTLSLTRIPRFIKEFSTKSHGIVTRDVLHMRLLGGANRSTIPTAMMALINCGDIQNLGTDRLTAKLANMRRDYQSVPESTWSTLYSFFEETVRASQQTCEQWPTAPRPQTGVSVASSIPTLLLTGEMDPMTPPEYAVIATEDLTQWQSLIFPYTGHEVVSARTCARDIFLNFLEDPTTNLPIGCIDKITWDYFSVPD